MASIQQSFNQVLATAAAGAALYAHSPAGKAKAEDVRAARIAKQKVKTENEEVQKKLEEQERASQMKAFELEPTAKRGEALFGQRPDTDPMKQSIGSGKFSAQGFGSMGKRSESKAIRSFYERAETKQEQKQSLENRFAMVTGKYDNSVWEEYTDGK